MLAHSTARVARRFRQDAVRLLCCDQPRALQGARQYSPASVIGRCAEVLRRTGRAIIACMVDRAFSDARLAALYDALHPRSRDFDFYLPLVMAAHAVLDVGCGTGALLHEARRSGHTGRLCGLDPAVGMLAQARRRADIEWRLGTVGAAQWDQEFDLVVMTGHAFQVLIEDSELRAALKAVHRVLRTGARFAFETRNPAARAWEGWTADQVQEVLDQHGAAVRVSRQVQLPFDGRTVTFTETFSSRSWEQVETSRTTLRFLDAAEVASRLDAAGFVVEEQFGDFDRAPLAPASPEIITIARAERG